MNEDAKKRPESRLFAIASTLALAAIVVALPGRFRIFPEWLPIALVALVVLMMIAAGVAPVGSIWAKAERWAIGIFVCLGLANGLIVLKELVQDIIIQDRALSAQTLLATSIALWLANVLYFALSYWQLDRGGPDGRAAGRNDVADFSFAAEEREPNFQPAFADYLFDAFTTSTAFSPTDTLPLTRRAKMLMMVQSAISLVTLVVVAARAINILR